MITRALTLLTCLTLCAACTSGSNTKDDVEAAEAPKTMLDVHEVTVTKPDGGAFMTLAADGKVLLEDVDAPVGPGHYTTITADGVATLADGSPFLTLSDDGAVLAASGEPIGVTIAADGTATNADMPKPLIFDENGHMGEPGNMATVEHVGGTDNPRSRRAVAFAFITLFAFASRPETIEAAPAAAPKVMEEGTRSTGRGAGGVGADDPEANPMEDEDPADQM